MTGPTDAWTAGVAGLVSSGTIPGDSPVPVHAPVLPAWAGGHGSDAAGTLPHWLLLLVAVPAFVLVVAVLVEAADRVAGWLLE